MRAMEQKQQAADTIMRYMVTRRFTGGILAGLTHTGETRHAAEVGTRVDKPIGGSPYVITECTQIP
jgi:hypothetical protein